MQDFTFISPTKIYFGHQCLSNLSDVLKDYHHVLFVYGQNSIKKNKIYDQIISALKDANVKYTELSHIEVNPKLRKVVEGTKLAKLYQVDFILAVGGGSVIDTSKAIACNYYYDGDEYDFNAHLATPNKALDIGVVLTHSAAGSELSNSCVITNEQTKVKNGFNSDLVRPKYAFLNPEFTFTLSKFQTSCGICDMFMHTYERYLTDTTDNIFTDELSIGLLKTVIKASKIVLNDPLNYEARAALMLASSYCHNGISGVGNKFYFTVHKLEHILSGMDDKIYHAAGLSALVTSWSYYLIDKLYPKLAYLGRNLFALTNNDDLECAKETIECVKSFFKSLDLPTDLTSLGFGEDKYDEFAMRITKNNQVKVPCIKPLDRDDVLNILRSAK